MDAKLLTEVIAKLTERTVTVEHSHMLKPWEMVFGGLVLPMLAEMDASVKADPQYAELVARYSKDEVEKFFATKVEVIEKVKTVKVETVKVIDRIVGGAGMTRMPTLHVTVKDGGKFRRLKDKVAKVARKVNDIPPDGRDAINRWWNNAACLTVKGDCQPIADEINGWGICSPLSAAQVSGWLSWLCRLALNPTRSMYIAIALHKGTFSVEPMFPATLCNAIANNKLIKKVDRETAARAKAHMKAEVEAALKSGAPATA